MNSLVEERVCLAVSGASGAIYAVRLLQILLRNNIRVDLIYTAAAKRVLLEECDILLEDNPGVLWSGVDGLEANECHRLVDLHDSGNIGARPASGSGGIKSVIVLPCSLETLASIASGRADNLVTRAAQVALKEQRRLVLCPRETPLSRVHLDCMSRLAWAGSVILPASPGFYHRPQSIDDLVDHLCFKILDSCQLSTSDIKRWDGSE